MSRTLFWLGPLLVVSCGSPQQVPSSHTVVGAPKATGAHTVPSSSAPTTAATVAVEAVPASKAVEAMVRIPGGKFMMGSSDGFMEGPPHEVQVESFEMERTEVTVEAYEACVQAGACTVRNTILSPGRKIEPNEEKACNWGKPERAQHPMNCVDSNDATSYCAWAGKRLPTEEEWEYAARGTENRIYPWGSEAPESQLCWRRRGVELGTCAVGSFPQGATPLGLMDMMGNVEEWTSSHSSVGYDVPPSRVMLVGRGGGWMMANRAIARASLRHGLMPTDRLNGLGFRCVRSAVGSDS